MSNLAENKHGTGGVYSPKDESVKLLSEIAKDTKPFDWNVGFDITHKTGFELVTKDQGSAGSCGGEATSYFMEVLHSLNSGKYEEESAKFIYAPCAVPGGGSSELSLTSRLKEVGSASEALCPSYINGLAPTEAFMDRISDITLAAVADAHGKRVKDVSYVQRNLDSIAQAVRDFGGVIIGIYGQNGNAWLSAFPKAPRSPVDESMWAHWLYVGKAQIINGIEYIGVKQSWGNNVGDKGWQWLDASHMPYLWTAFTYITLDIVSGFTHRFNTPMQLADSGPEVSALQEALKVSGEFPSTQAITGYFGLVTLAAVKAFQQRYSSEILIPAGVTVPTGRVLAFTLAKLNSLYNH